MKKELGISILLLALCVVTAILNPKFISPVNLTNMANVVGLFGIFSLGLGLVIITGGIDLSVGSMFALSGVLLAMALKEWNWVWPIAALAAIAIPMVLGKWLAMDPQVMILDEPTRGIDVGAKAEIYRLMRELASRGTVILMISSDMEEVLNISDRVAVMHEGEISGVLARGDCTEENIMQLAVGKKIPAAKPAFTD